MVQRRLQRHNRTPFSEGTIYKQCRQHSWPHLLPPSVLPAQSPFGHLIQPVYVLARIYLFIFTSLGSLPLYSLKLHNKSEAETVAGVSPAAELQLIRVLPPNLRRRL